MGFTFDDTDTKGVASPLSEMHRLIEKDPRNQEAIFPYIGGQEVNTSPTHAHHRYVINFADFPLRRESVETGGAGVPEDSRVPADGLAEPVTSWVNATDEQRRAWLQRGNSSTRLSGSGSGGLARTVGDRGRESEAGAKEARG